MTFTEALIASGYEEDFMIGSYVKEDRNGNVHTYLESDEVKGEWSYIKYDSDGWFLRQVIFSV